MTPTVKRFLPVGVVSVAVFIVLGLPLLQNQALFWGTPALQFVGWRLQAWEYLKQGQMPWWNPMNGMGAPLAANYQSALFYPPGWILFPITAGWGAAGVAWGLTFLNLLHMIWAGAGMARLMQKLGYDTLAQTVAGLAFAMCGFFIARQGFFSMIWTGAWLPWLIAETQLLIEPNSEGHSQPHSYLRDWLPRLPLVAVVALMLLAGHAQLAWYNLLLTGLWLVFFSFRRRGMRGMLQGLASFGLAGILAGLIAAIQLVPTAEYLAVSQRAGEYGFESAMAYSMWPWRLLTFVTPDLFGNPGEGSYWGFGAYWEDAVYLGLIPLLLAIRSASSVFSKKRSDPSNKETRAIIVWGWGVVALAVLLALGSHTPVFPFLYRYIPTFDMFQAPTRFMFLAEFSLAMLAGIGAAQWGSPIGRGLYWSRLATAGSAAVAIGAGIGWASLSGVEQTFVRAFALAGVLGSAYGLLTLFKPVGGRRLMAWMSIALAVMVADLVWFALPANPFAPTSLYSNVRFEGAQRIGDHRVYLPASDEYLIKFKRFLRFRDFRPVEVWTNLWRSGLPNSNLITGISSANNFDPLIPDRYARWRVAVDSTTGAARDQLLTWMDVLWVGRYAPNHAGGVIFTENNQASFVHWYSCADPAGSVEEAIQMVLARVNEAGNFPVDKAVIEGENKPTTECSDPGTPELRVPERTAQSVVVLVEADTSGYLMVSQTIYPGWRVVVDGEEQDLLILNGVFQGVHLESGLHEVRFEYRPKWACWATAASVVGLLILAWLKVIQAREKN